MSAIFGNNLFGNKLKVYPMSLVEPEFDIFGKRISIDDYEVYSEYDPFDFYNSHLSDNRSENLHLKFISIDRSNSSDIFSFISEYGLLGIQPNPQDSPDDYYSGPFSNLAKNCDTDSIAFEIGAMRFLSNLAYRDMNASVDDLYQLILNAYMYTNTKGIDLEYKFVIEKSIEKAGYFDIATNIAKNRYEYIKHRDYTGKCDISFFKESLSEFYGDDIDILNKVADNIIIESVNLNTRNLYSFLSEPTLGSPKTSKYTLKWKTDTLLSALYSMFIFDLTKNTLIKACANPNCSNYFDASKRRKDAIYCNDKCNDAVAQQRRRDKDRLKRKEKSNGKY
jgi:hypothetical protein